MYIYVRIYIYLIYKITEDIRACRCRRTAPFHQGWWCTQTCSRRVVALDLMKKANRCRVHWFCLKMWAQNWWVPPSTNFDTYPYSIGESSMFLCEKVLYVLNHNCIVLKRVECWCLHLGMKSKQLVILKGFQHLEDLRHFPESLQFFCSKRWREFLRGCCTLRRDRRSSQVVCFVLSDWCLWSWEMLANQGLFDFVCSML